jgi:hypothetical protein
MQMTRDSVPVSSLITLLAGAIAALGIWLVAGQPEAAAFGFVIAAAARDTGSRRGCVRRVLRGAR